MVSTWVDGWRDAVVVFIPEHDDGRFLPSCHTGESLMGLHDGAEGLVADADQARG